MTKNIFSYNPDINKNAYLNWRTSNHEHINNMIVIAKGFMNSALMLANDAVNDNKDKKADIIIYPILFNANHAIELYLKAITWRLNVLLKNDRKIEGSHNIEQILETVKARVKELNDNQIDIDDFNNIINGLDLYVKELFQKIRTSSEGKINMDFSRYPFDQKYTPHFYIDEFDNVVVDLENFINRFIEIGDNLNYLANHYLYDFDNQE